MALEYGKRIDGLFEALNEEQSRLEASDDIRALAGWIVVSPGKDGKAMFWLEGDLAAILTLAAGKKTTADLEDGRVVTSMVAGARKHRNLPIENLALFSKNTIRHSMPPH